MKSNETRGSFHVEQNSSIVPVFRLLAKTDFYIRHRCVGRIVDNRPTRKSDNVRIFGAAPVGHLKFVSFMRAWCVQPKLARGESTKRGLDLAI
jgi:hypothetical protein